MKKKQQQVTVKADPTFRKPTAITQMVNRYSAPEHKMMNLCLALASEVGFSRPKYDMAVSTVKYYMGAEKTKNNDWLKAVAEGLTTKKIEWNGLRQDRTVEWGICTFLSSASIIGSRFYFRLNPEIVERLHHPKVWGQFRLLAQIRMAKRYSLVIYGFLKDATCRLGVEEGCEIEVTLDDLRMLLGLKPEEYREYKFFNQFVLKPALDPKKGEINLLSDLDVAYRGMREGRKVQRLSFKISQKSQFQLALDLPQLGLPAPKAALDLEQKSPQEVNALCELLEEHGIEQAQAMKLIVTHTEERIRENVQYVDDEIATGKAIKNRAAYLVRAIERDFRSNAASAQAKQRTEGVQQQARAELHHKLRPDWDQYREEQAMRYFQELPESEQIRHREVFVKSLSGSLAAHFQQQGWDNPVVVKAFRDSYLTRKLLKKPEEKDLDAYCAWKTGQKRQAA